jgi:adenylyltransferase/sulfurtransferase
MDARSALEKISELQIIDVRDPDELEAGFIEGAVNIPLPELPARLAEISPERPILAVCETGQRSYEAAELLEAQGFEAHNLEGGMWGWNLRGLPVVDRDGGPSGSAGREWRVPGK